MADARCREADANDCVRRCRAGDASGCAELGRLLVADDGLRRDVALAAALAGAACDAGDGRGCAVLGRLCAERLVYPGAWAECTAERVARAADAEHGVCSGACDASIFDAIQPVSTSR